jgi:DNA modification methylase
MKLGPYEVPGHYLGDAIKLLGDLPDRSIHCCVTSPPYWGLRSYLEPGDPAKASELGAEETLEEYVLNMTRVFREVRRVLRNDGTLWLNLGDRYHKKNLAMVPYRTALALQDDGWTLRSNIVWAKPNPMPESVKDRPTAAHESVFLFAKSGRYYYDADAVREPDSGRASGNKSRIVATAGEGQRTNSHLGSSVPWEPGGGRNMRNVWTVAPRPKKGSHYAVFPPQLVEPMIKAGCPEGGVVLDPFIGSGTVGQVAESLGRSWLGFDLDRRNGVLIKKRTAQTTLLQWAYSGGEHVRS